MRDQMIGYFSSHLWLDDVELVGGRVACGACLLLYDGSPALPSADILFDFADEGNMTFFGTSAKYIDALNKLEQAPHS